MREFLGITNVNTDVHLLRRRSLLDPFQGKPSANAVDPPVHTQLQLILEGKHQNRPFRQLVTLVSWPDRTFERGDR